jgi:hypothetical protein
MILSSSGTLLLTASLNFFSNTASSSVNIACDIFIVRMGGKLLQEKIEIGLVQ